MLTKSEIKKGYEYLFIYITILFHSVHYIISCTTLYHVAYHSMPVRGKE